MADQRQCVLLSSDHNSPEEFKVLVSGLLYCYSWGSLQVHCSLARSAVDVVMSARQVNGLNCALDFHCDPRIKGNAAPDDTMLSVEQANALSKDFNIQLINADSALFEEDEATFRARVQNLLSQELPQYTIVVTTSQYLALYLSAVGLGSEPVPSIAVFAYNQESGAFTERWRQGTMDELRATLLNSKALLEKVPEPPKLQVRQSQPEEAKTEAAAAEPFRQPVSMPNTPNAAPGKFGSQINRPEAGAQYTPLRQSGAAAQQGKPSVQADEAASQARFPLQPGSAGPMQSPLPKPGQGLPPSSGPVQFQPKSAFGQPASSQPPLQPAGKVGPMQNSPPKPGQGPPLGSGPDQFQPRPAFGQLASTQPPLQQGSAGPMQNSLPKPGQGPPPSSGPDQFQPRPAFGQPASTQPPLQPAGKVGSMQSPLPKPGQGPPPSSGPGLTQPPLGGAATQSHNAAERFAVPVAVPQPAADSLLERLTAQFRQGLMPLAQDQVPQHSSPVEQLLVTLAFAFQTYEQKVNDLTTRLQDKQEEAKQKEEAFEQYRKEMSNEQQNLRAEFEAQKNMQKEIEGRVRTLEERLQQREKPIEAAPRDVPPAEVRQEGKAPEPIHEEKKEEEPQPNTPLSITVRVTEDGRRVAYVKTQEGYQFKGFICFTQEGRYITYSPGSETFAGAQEFDTSAWPVPPGTYDCFIINAEGQALCSPFQFTENPVQQAAEYTYENCFLRINTPNIADFETYVMGQKSEKGLETFKQLATKWKNPSNDSLYQFAQDLISVDLSDEDAARKALEDKGYQF